MVGKPYVKLCTKLQSNWTTDLIQCIYLLELCFEMKITIKNSKNWTTDLIHNHKEFKRFSLGHAPSFTATGQIKVDLSMYI